MVEDLTSPLCVWAAGHGHTAAYLHWLFALSQRTSVVGISGERQQHHTWYWAV